MIVDSLWGSMFDVVPYGSYGVCMEHSCSMFASCFQAWSLYRVFTDFEKELDLMFDVSPFFVFLIGDVFFLSLTR